MILHLSHLTLLDPVSEWPLNIHTFLYFLINIHKAGLKFVLQK